MIVDAHQHFWDPARGDYGWLTPDMPIHRPFTTQDLRPLLVETGVDATILVQAAPTEAETDYLLAIAKRTPWVLGVVGWLKLDAPDAPDQVRARAADTLFLGVRPMLQDLSDPEWILQSMLTPALHAIAAEGLVFDALVKPQQLRAVAELARQHPQLSIVLDHAAKPRIGDSAALAEWFVDMQALAQLPNVTCKLSGLLTEMAPGAGETDLRMTAGLVCDAFGPERLIWGSDWPVLTLSNASVGGGEYRAWFELAREIVAAKSPMHVPDVMGGNALRVYRPSRMVRA